MDLEKMSYAELKALATSLDVKFKSNISTATLLEKIKNKQAEEEIEKEVKEEKEEKYTLDEIIALIEETNALIKSKKERNETINKSNKYIDGRIQEAKNTNASTKKKQIENLNKVKLENSRQYQVNAQIIVENEEKLMKMESLRDDMIPDFMKEKENEYKELKQQLADLPIIMSQTISDLYNKYLECHKANSKAKSELTALSKKFKVKLNEPTIEKRNITVSEAHQLINAFRDLSKIQFRMKLRQKW